MPEQLEYQGVWWHRKDDGSIHRAEGSSWIRWSPGDPGPQPPPWMLTAPAPVPYPVARDRSDDLRKFIVGAIIFGLLIAAGGWLSEHDWNLGGGGKSSSNDGNFSAEVTSFEPVDEANLRVFFDVTNKGSSRGKAECSFMAKDASGLITGSDSLVGVPVAPGETERGNVVLRIEDEGAFRVQDVKVRDC